MRFVLHEIKLWFQNGDDPKSYKFLADRINVVTGDATTGKTSFWSIIDYCLLSGKVNIANTIYEKVEWFGIHLSVDDREISIARKSPKRGTVAADVFFQSKALPEIPEVNSTISEIKAFLDVEFGIDDSLRFPFGKDLGQSSFNISYRHFLLFNSLTETVIGAPETYFDTTFYGKTEYDDALTHIFNLIIGVNDIAIIKAKERLEEIEAELKKIQRQQNKNIRNQNSFESSVLALFNRCKQHNFIEYSTSFIDPEWAISFMNDIVSTNKEVIQNSNLFEEIENLDKRRIQIQSEVNSVDRYHRELKSYYKNLKKSSDSLQPIEFLNSKLSDQLVDSYETRAFVDTLEVSLQKIKDSLSREVSPSPEPLGNLAELKKELTDVTKRLAELLEIRKDYFSRGEKFMILGEIKHALQNLPLYYPKSIDKVLLNSLNEEKDRLEKIPVESSQIKHNMRSMLNESIQRNFNLLHSLPAYQNSRIDFNPERMILQLYPEGQLFPLDNVGSKSNYMFMHLCVYLGLHEHMINIEQAHVPQFLFIDQPSIPYYTGDDDKGNDDKTKLLDAFKLLNTFLEYIIVDKQDHFQIFMVEHAPRDYWESNDLKYFHTVDEFINGKGLIPNNVYNS